MTIIGLRVRNPEKFFNRSMRKRLVTILVVKKTVDSLMYKGMF